MHVPRLAQRLAALGLSAVCVAGVSILAVPPMAAARPALPVNSCGETGFDPEYYPPDTSTIPIVPKIEIPTVPPVVTVPLPYPEIVPVPLPDPPADNTRVAADPMTDHCSDPCPDLTDEQPDPDPDAAAGSSGIPFPRLELDPQPQTIPIPVPGPPGDPLPPPPAAASPTLEPAPPVPAPAAPAVGDVAIVGQLTGHGSENRTDKRWQVNGTDLGLTWESKPGEVSVAFGDTFGKDWRYGVVGGEEDWRSNVLGHSTDTNLDDGMTIDSMVQDSRCHAAEILASRKVSNWETTVIPTSGFAIGDRQYLSYMSVRRWSVIPGMWWTNYGGIAYSDDDGQTWTKDPYAKWNNIFGFDGFQVSAMVPAGDWVYMFGTPNGRIGTVGLARVPKDQVLNKTAYQYWVAGNWVPIASGVATPVMIGLSAEQSVRYDAAADKWQMSYLDPVRGEIVLREADEPQGNWSEPSKLMSSADYPKIYGGFIHPWSTENALYFTASEWDSYNTYLVKADLN